jgi:uncharacterized protein
MHGTESYLDTSVLAKRYIEEPGSEEVDRFLSARSRVLISRLTVLELRCVFARQLRSGTIDDDYERQALAALSADIRSGWFQVEPLADHHAVEAFDMISRLRDPTLRALDALHLAIARGIGAKTLATADRRMADAAQALGMEVVTFG